MTRKEKAMNYFKEGFNCSQSVVLAYSDMLDADESFLLKLSSSFGGGLGRLREVCGAVSGMAIVTGILYGYDDSSSKEDKAEHYKRIQELAHEFEKRNGSIVCRELLGLNVKHDEPTPEARTAEYYKKRPCVELVGDAAEILEEYINNNPKK
ncbi:MAG: C-GCAxxG-C-C family protein [Lachnospiraceae bacterium]|nr:C-GCAxxG-C-C family protein [Lachnospiraceae bacterium]